MEPPQRRDHRRASAGCGSARWTTANRRPTGYLFRCVGGLCTDSGLPPVAITNGPALNAEGTVLYHTDTLGRVIYRVPVNDDGSLGAPAPFVTIEDGGGYPDGPVVDAEGCLWTGLYAGWSVRRYDPAGQADQDRPPADRQRHQDVLRRARPEDRLRDHRAQEPRRRRARRAARCRQPVRVRSGRRGAAGDPGEDHRAGKAGKAFRDGLSPARFDPG